MFDATGICPVRPDDASMPYFVPRPSNAAIFMPATTWFTCDAIFFMIGTVSAVSAIEVAILYEH
jgi:hypothetical protein